MRFEQRFNIKCANLITDSGDELKWVEECRYLGVYLVSARRFNAVGIMKSARLVVYLMRYLAG